MCKSASIKTTFRHTLRGIASYSAAVHKFVNFNYCRLYIIHCFAGSLGQTTHQPSVWCSKYYYFFHNFFQTLCKNLYKIHFISIYFLKFFEVKIKSPSIYQKLWKKKLGTSNAWSVTRSSKRTSEAAYHIINCQILHNQSNVMNKENTSLLYFEKVPTLLPHKYGLLWPEFSVLKWVHPIIFVSNVFHNSHLIQKCIQNQLLILYTLLNQMRVVKNIQCKDDSITSL